jgi:prepilin-type N-terminal cleavage/methylation domain-containing protein
MLKNQKGFTLFEILIATGILAFLSLGINSIVSSSADTKDEVTREDRQFLQIYTALNRIEIDFTQIYSPLYFTVKEKTLDELEAQARENGEDFDQSNLDNPGVAYQGSERYPGVSRKGEPIGAILQEDKGKLIFPTMSNRRKVQNSKESRFAWVRYSLGSVSEQGEGEESRGDDLIRNFSAIDPYAKDFDWENTEDQVLLQNVKSITFEFFDKSKEKWVERLQETGLDQDTPRAMRVVLIWMNENNKEEEFVRVFRPLWPYFDTVADEKARQKALKANTDGSNPGSSENDEERDED